MRSALATVLAPGLHCVAFLEGGLAYLVAGHTVDVLATVCEGNLDAALPTTCRERSERACGSRCGPDNPLECGPVPKASDAGTP